MRRHAGFLTMLPVILGAYALRLWRITAAPPGWADDELSNALVISQRVLNGEWAVYYTDASGHEALYHALVAGTMRLFGENWLGIRYPSIIFGTLSVAATYRLGRIMFGRNAGVTAAALLAVSYWGLHYSRVGQRHVSMPFFMLLAFCFFWIGLRRLARGRSGWTSFGLSGVALGLGFYTYFAARGMPLILVGFVAYLAVRRMTAGRRPRTDDGGLPTTDGGPRRDRWWPEAVKGLVVTLVVAGVLAVPLVVSVNQQDGADARVEELATPVVDARNGDYSTLLTHVRRSLFMFHTAGDDEYLYNIPGRPIFGPITAAVFWAGVALALLWGVRSLWRRERSVGPPSVFLLGWWLAGLAPAFLSVPPASMSHTIAAQPATYVLVSLPVVGLSRWLRGIKRPVLARALVPAAALLLLGLVAVRDLPDYYTVWPERGLVRFLFHANMADVAQWSAENPDVRDFAVGGTLLGPWEREALRLELAYRGVDDAHPRRYDPARAAFQELAGGPGVVFHGFPAADDAFLDLYMPPESRVGDYSLSRLRPVGETSFERLACFENGLCLDALHRGSEPGTVALVWRVTPSLELPPMPLIGKPAPPGVYDGPRLLVFAQVLDANGTFLTGDDGLWVDPLTLQPADVFWQRHVLGQPAGAHTLAVGLYDPLTGERILTDDGRDAVRLSWAP